ncbi:hypothetical protein C2869_14990 [Saccharobesus litoralis]|uniref:Transmembrane protein n=1 Tax=Saccharobesus litoralis TaxID=2172099 RepID=A0A2S0VU09_9ALTE|nr:BPSS1780 family membrane protein [Saccharobesus litoralis]AWB67662.1 hypothetical protein C2869_14990 [Saccharobesus litoralis]
MSAHEQSNKPIATYFNHSIKSFEFKRGFDWVSQGFEIFAKHSLLWTVSYLTLIVLTLLIPVVGQVLTAILSAGLFIIAQNIDSGEKFKISDMFEIFKRAPVKILILSILNSLVFFLCVSLFVDQKGLTPESITSMTPEQMSQLLIDFCLGFCMYLIPAMAFIFSPILVSLHPNITLWQSIEFSFKACLINTVPATAFGLVFIGLFLLAMIPMGLGLIFVIPIGLCALYVAHKDIFCVVPEFDDEDEQQPPNSDQSNDVISA